MRECLLQEKTHITPKGTIHYWIEKKDDAEITLVLLPGLTADHRLFDKQIEYITGKYNLVVWDAPDKVNTLIQEFINTKVLQ